MATRPSPHILLASPPRYEKPSRNENNTVRYDQRDPAPRYSPKVGSREGADINGALVGLSQGSADDKLPPYAPTIQLLTLCRRKNEFDAKDRKAKKRSWGLVWLLLDGTALRMYQPTTAEMKKFEKEWDERYCRKGPVKKVVAPVEPEEEEDSDVEEEVLDVHSALVQETRTSTRPPHRRGRSSSTAKAPFESTPSPPVPQRIRTNTTTFSPTSHLPNQPPSSSTRPGLNIPFHPQLPNILTRKPQISHPIRNITCTRATTYFKRNFVLRFVLEDGKQFLVQLNNHEETLVWQEIVNIAAPLALDIDERSMPEPAPYPRSRRRTQTTILERRPSTAPGAIDTALVQNLPPEYQATPSTSTTTHTDGGMRRRRSLSGL